MSSALRLPKGSLVFVTGGTGLVGSAVVEELVKRGYKVRLATRDTSKTTLFAEKLKKLYGEGLLEPVQLSDLTAENAYDGLLDGVDGVIHIATDLSFSSDVESTVQNAIQITLNLLKAASKISSIKAFVLTSSRIAVYNPEYGKDGEYPLSTFADYFYDLGMNAKDDDPLKPVLAYAASKVKAERAAWEYYDQAKPNYSFNVVLPDLVLGPVSNPAPGHYSTASWLTELYNGNSSGQIVAFLNPPARIVDVRDVAIIHVAALLDESVNKERLWAAAHTVHVDEILDIWKEAYPEKKGVLPGKIGLPQPPKQVIDTSRSDELLQKFEGRSWIDKKTTLVENVRA